MSGIRINKYLSEVGYCSRREGDKLVEAKRVRINGVIAEMGSRVGSVDEVHVDGQLVSPSHQPRIYIVYNKPVGITCTTDLRVHGNIIQAVNHPKRVFPIGRLDKPSQGLILLTDDGDIVNKILRARNHHEKEYVVKVDKPITPKFLKRMRAGVPILDTVTRPCTVEKMDSQTFRIILTQGLNRQIRRMCQYLSYNVTFLKRVRIMNLHLDVPPGEWRDLTPEELEALNALLVDSQKTHEHSETTLSDDARLSTSDRVNRNHRSSRSNDSNVGPKKNRRRRRSRPNR